MPGEVKVGQFDGAFLNDLARGGLARFAGQDLGRQRLGLALGEGALNLRHDFLGLDVAGDNEEDVVGDVPVAVISQNVLRLERVKNVRVANDGEAIGAFGVGAFEQAPSGAPSGIILVHVHFAADDVQFLAQLVGWQGGVLHDVAKDVDGHGGAGVGHVDVIDGAIKGSESVHVTPGRLHLLIDAAAGPGCGALEKHVLQHMGQTGSEPFPLRDAPRLAPGLGGHHRCAVVFPRDDRQAILQGRQPRSRRHGWDFGRGAARTAVGRFEWQTFTRHKQSRPILFTVLHQAGNDKELATRTQEMPGNSFGRGRISFFSHLCLGNGLSD